MRPEQFGFLVAVTEILIRDIFAYDKRIYLTVFQHNNAIIMVIIIIRIIIPAAKVLLFFDISKRLFCGCSVVVFIGQCIHAGRAIDGFSAAAQR